jgi:ubiquinol-cytochrome c reductase cytochrome b subunit
VHRTHVKITHTYCLGGLTFFMFLVLTVTGVLLMFYYVPDVNRAYQDIAALETNVKFGLLMRNMHRWTAHAMVILVFLHMLRVFYTGAYKPPREFNWVVGVILLVLTLVLSFTGYLLPWDQKAYWATAVGTNIAGTTPVVGGALVALLRGGSELGAATLARFYAFHVLWLPLLLTVLVALHLVVVVRQGIAARPRDLEVGAPRTTKDPNYPAFYRDAYAASKRGGVRFWPDILGKDAIVSASVVLVIVLLAALFGAPLETPADPTDTAYIPRPEWYFLPVYQLLKLVPGSMESLVAVGVPTVFVLVLLALPFFDRGSKRNLLHRPAAMVSLALVLGGAGFLIGAAGRAPEGAAMEGGGPLNSVQRAGRALYQSQQCGGCHLIAGQGGEEGPDLTAVGLRHSAGWLHSFLESPSRFHAESRMPAYGPPALTHQEIEELAQYLASRRGRGATDVAPQFYDTFPPPRRP